MLLVWRLFIYYLELWYEVTIFIRNNGWLYCLSFVDYSWLLCIPSFLCSNNRHILKALGTSMDICNSSLDLANWILWRICREAFGSFSTFYIEILCAFSFLADLPACELLVFCDSGRPFFCAIYDRSTSICMILLILCFLCCGSKVKYSWITKKVLFSSTHAQ